MFLKLYTISSSCIRFLINGIPMSEIMVVACRMFTCSLWLGQVDFP